MTEIVAFCFVLLALTVFVAAPLYARSSTTAEVPAHDDPDAGRRATQRALHDLEIDRASGLVGEAEYAEEKSALESRWRTVPRQASD
ncbi:MAG: hypothetical protein WD646_09310 [Actinomycetota bacterium]